MKSVQKIQTRKEQRVTQQFYSDSNQDVPVLVQNSSESRTMEVQNLSTNQNQNVTSAKSISQQSRTVMTSSNQSFESDFCDDASNLSNSSTSINSNSTNSRKAVKTSKMSNSTKINTMSSHSSSFDDDRSSISLNQGQDSQNRNSNSRQISQSQNTTTLEQSLKSKPMKTCNVEDIWTIEETRYVMYITVGRQYRPEDVNISMKDRVMSIVVKNHSGGFGKSFTVPSDADFQGIKSTFTDDAKLKIEVPKNNTSLSTNTSSSSVNSNTSKVSRTSKLNQTFSADSLEIEDERNNSNNSVNQSILQSQDVNNTTSQKVQMTKTTKTNKTVLLEQVADDVRSTGSVQDVRDVNQRTDTSNLTLEESLKSKAMKTCRVEDIWEIEETRYTMLIRVGSGYRPEDVNITMSKDRVMTVLVENSSGGFGKSFTVPDDADFNGMKSTFTEDGYLKIVVTRITTTTTTVNSSKKSTTSINTKKTDERLSQNTHVQNNERNKSEDINVLVNVNTSPSITPSSTSDEINNTNTNVSNKSVQITKTIKTQTQKTVSSDLQSLNTVEEDNAKKTDVFVNQSPSIQPASSSPDVDNINNTTTTKVTNVSNTTKTNKIFYISDSVDVGDDDSTNPSVIPVQNVDTNVSTKKLHMSKSLKTKTVLTDLGETIDDETDQPNYVKNDTVNPTPSDSPAKNDDVISPLVEAPTQAPSATKDVSDTNVSSKTVKISKMTKTQTQKTVQLESEVVDDERDQPSNVNNDNQAPSPAQNDEVVSPIVESQLSPAPTGPESPDVNDTTTSTQVSTKTVQISQVTKTQQKTVLSDSVDITDTETDQPNKNIPVNQEPSPARNDTVVSPAVESPLSPSPTSPDVNDATTNTQVSTKTIQINQSTKTHQKTVLTDTETDQPKNISPDTEAPSPSRNNEVVGPIVECPFSPEPTGPESPDFNDTTNNTQISTKTIQMNQSTKTHQETVLSDTVDITEAETDQPSNISPDNEAPSPARNNDDVSPIVECPFSPEPTGPAGNDSITQTNVSTKTIQINQLTKTSQQTVSSDSVDITDTEPDQPNSSIPVSQEPSPARNNDVVSPVVESPLSPAPTGPESTDFNDTTTNTQVSTKTVQISQSTKTHQQTVLSNTVDTTDTEPNNPNSNIPVNQEPSPARNDTVVSPSVESPVPSPSSTGQDLNTKISSTTVQVNKVTKTQQKTVLLDTVDTTDEPVDQPNQPNGANQEPSPIQNNDDVSPSAEPQSLSPATIPQVVNSTTENTNVKSKTVQISKTTKTESQQTVFSDNDQDVPNQTNSKPVAPTTAGGPSASDVPTKPAQNDIPQTPDTSNLTLEESLKSKPMKTCNVEEIWTIEETQYIMLIKIGKQYKPEDVNITMDKDRVMTVLVENNTGGFGKSFTVPTDGDFEGMKSTFTEDGYLKIVVTRITTTTTTTNTNTRSTKQVTQKTINATNTNKTNETLLQNTVEDERNNPNVCSNETVRPTVETPALSPSSSTQDVTSNNTNITSKTVQVSKMTKTQTQQTIVSESDDVDIVTNETDQSRPAQKPINPGNGPSPSSPLSSTQLVQDVQYSNIQDTVQTTDTKKPVKTSKITDIWKEEDTNFTMEIPVGKEYQEEDVYITTKGRILIVEVKKTGQQGFEKRITVPSDCDINSVKTTITSYGYLRIEITRIVTTTTTTTTNTKNVNKKSINTRSNNETIAIDTVDDVRNNRTIQSQPAAPSSVRKDSIDSTTSSTNNTSKTIKTSTISNTTRIIKTFGSQSFDEERYSNNVQTQNIQTTDTSKMSTLQQSLDAKPMKQCAVEDIWEIEETRYTMVITVGHGYEPEDVNVTLKGRVMSVVVEKDGAGFGKSFTIPHDADFESIKSTFTKSRKLVIEVTRVTSTSNFSSVNVNTSNTTKTQKTTVSQLDSTVNQQTNNTLTNDEFCTSHLGRDQNSIKNTNTSKATTTTLEESLQSKPMKTCQVEEIWKVEANRYFMLIPVGAGYGPENVNITTKNRIMSIVVKNDFGGFGKSFSIPHDADFQGIKKSFTADGNLRIEVPRIK